MKLRAILILSVLAILLGFFSLWMAQQSYSWFPPEAAAESKLVDDLFSIFVGLGTFILLGVTIPILYSLVFHRAGKYDFSDGPHIEGNTLLEIIWTAVPIVLVLGLSTASYRTYDKMSIRGPMELVHLHLPQLVEVANAAPFDDTPQQEIETAQKTAPTEDIEVTAKQWSWVFRYPDQNVTSTELHLPVDRRIHLAMHSDDVLHGFYVPAFRLKQDIVPNRTIDFEFTPVRIGTYPLRDSLYSGTYFAANQANIVVQSPADYQQWLTDAAAQTPSPAYNQADFEYTRGTKSGNIGGWKSVTPASPPIVNYSPKAYVNSSPD
ncbi:MAG: cytochrome c oxidase subunit II [Timaviella obliquedivisa GSE-PSE-MK23-08B]|jgi:cytochrome c oxidase subunit 2|nr:cytochrome c oxidase subunit II [Timaviella obliquedivisa GSE-PSE-MK23-08B]